MHDVPARILALKPPLDFLALSPVQFLPLLPSLQSGPLSLRHGKLNLDCWMSQARLGWQSTPKLSDGVEPGFIQAWNSPPRN
jgi:hypothetical protein